MNINKYGFPDVSPQDNPEVWQAFWDQQKSIVRYPNSKEYRQAYYANKTKARQIVKLHELMNKYSDDAKAHVYIV